MVPRDEIVAALAGVLKPEESIEHVAPAVGASLVLTDARLVVVRDGASYRPSSGIRSWPLDRRLRLRLTEHRNGQSALRIAAGAGSEAVSLFVTTEQEPHVRHVLAEARRRASVSER